MQNGYQLYLFSQLFHNTLDESLEELDDNAYDLIFPIIENELSKFLNSEYNVDTKSEYDCMVDYLSDNADTINIQLADHCNI